jgi:hypothetical protein
MVFHAWFIHGGRCEVACRKVTTERQMRAARKLVDGQSAYRALIESGYSRWTARAFGKLLRGSWGLREAIRVTLEETGRHLAAHPQRRRRYDRRPIVKAALQYCGAEDRQAVTNTALHRLYANEQAAKRISAGLPPKADQPNRMVRCPSCGAMVDERKMFLDFTQTMSVCPRCAGVS